MYLSFCDIFWFCCECLHIFFKILLFETAFIAKNLAISHLPREIRRKISEACSRRNRRIFFILSICWDILLCKIRKYYSFSLPSATKGGMSADSISKDQPSNGKKTFFVSEYEFQCMCLNSFFTINIFQLKCNLWITKMLSSSGFIDSKAAD